MRRSLMLFLGMACLLCGPGCEEKQEGPTVPDAGPLIDRCLATSDMDLVLASRVDGGAVAAGLADPRVAVGYCTTSDECYPLVLNDDPAAVECIDACMATTPVAGLSDDCVLCYYYWLDCAGKNCLLECLGATNDGGSPELCYSCAETHCGADLTTCVGY